MNIVTLKAPKISSDERKQLIAQREELHASLAAFDGAIAKVADLRKKETEFEKSARKHEQAAAAFDTDSEIKLLAAHKGLQRIHEAIARAESDAHDDKHPLWPAIDNAQETISKICQATYNELLDQIASALAPFHANYESARWEARTLPAVNNLVSVLLKHNTGAVDSVERMVESARDVLRKVDALLERKEIWSFQGVEIPTAKSKEAAA